MDRSHSGRNGSPQIASSKIFPCLVPLGIAFMLILMTGCGTLDNGRGWGEDAVYPVNRKRVSSAIKNAFLDWGTWIPAGGALACSFDHFDERVSDWASKRNPLFGSMDSASRTANYLLFALETEVFVTALATPSGDDPKPWAYSKAKGLSVELGAHLATAAATSGVKGISHRERPGGEGNSFPSGHSSAAFSSATLANRNLDYISMNENLRLALQAGNVILAGATAWARVEAHGHFPTDVLVGAALGRFLSASIHDGFMGLPEEKAWSVNVFPVHGGAVLSLTFPF